MLDGSVDGFEQPFATVIVHQIIDSYVSDNSFNVPEFLNRFVVIEVSITNDGADLLSGDGLYFNRFDFEVSDTDGYRYWPASVIGPEPMLDSGWLALGDTVRGFIGLEVRENASLARVLYTPLGSDKPFVAAELQYEPVSASSDSVATATPSAPRLGEPLVLDGSVDGFEQPFATVIVHQIIDSYVSDNSFNVPEFGDRFVVIEVSITNDGDESMYFNPFHFELSDTDGYRYRPAGVIGPEPMLDFVDDLLPGDIVRGFIGLGVRENANLARVYYSPPRGNSFVAAELQ